MPVPTIHGIKFASQLEAGDILFTSNSTHIAVESVEVHSNRRVFTAMTDDSSIIKVGVMQKWYARLDRKDKRWTTRYTGDLYERHARSMRRPMLPEVKPILGLEGSDVISHPYTLGYWLGNGTRGKGHITLHSNDAEQIEIILNDFDYQLDRKNYPSIKGNACVFDVLGLRSELKKIGVLKKKFIPEMYFSLPETYRRLLIQGLMDSDGSVSLDTFYKNDCVKNGKIVVAAGTVRVGGQCEFCTTDKYIGEGFRKLLNSLGVKCQMLEGRALLKGKDCGPKYRVLFYYNEANLLPRKAARLRTPKKNCRYLGFMDGETIGEVAFIKLEDEGISTVVLVGEGYVPMSS